MNNETSKSAQKKLLEWQTILNVSCEYDYDAIFANLTSEWINWIRRGSIIGFHVNIN